MNIVRKDDYVQDLKQNFGVTHAYNSESPTFWKDVEAAIKQTEASLIYECVGGDLAAQIFELMPHKSHMVPYGNLSKQKASFKPEDFHKADKRISDFLIMFPWVSSLPLEERRKWFKVVADDL